MDKVDWSSAPDWADRALLNAGRWFYADENGYLNLVGDRVLYGAECEDVRGTWLALVDFEDQVMRPDEWKKGAERMEQIAQNGNDGQAYEDLEGIDKTLNERGCRYGEFCDNSRVAQELKRVMKSGKNADSLRDIQRESLEVIASKIARIVNGDPDYIDNWHDIIGYAKLVEIELEKEKG